MGSAFLIAAPHSGAGKTTVALAVLAALRARGLAVQPFKVGPDYIDPSHHARLTGRPSHNLDTWMVAPEVNRRLFLRALADADVGVVEGVMGLFDGVDGVRGDGSSAHLAALLGLPVLLVVDARSMARSAAALVSGFCRFDPNVKVVGVVWNRVGSPTHRRILDESLDAAGLPPALGAIPRDEGIALPERHLGLVTPDDAGPLGELAASLARLAEDHLDLDRLLALTLREAQPPGDEPAGPTPLAGKRIAVARDAAFCFYYDANLTMLREQGAELAFFRPTDGDLLPEGVDGVYLGGGYPEVHAARLSANRGFLEGLRTLHAAGVPLYAECGGFMALCRSLEDLEGRVHPMAGLFPADARMNQRAFRLGYREILVEGQRARGHEFHYSRVDAMPSHIPRTYHVCNARGEELPSEGYRLANTRGSYVHLHFASNPELPRLFFG